MTHIATVFRLIRTDTSDLGGAIADGSPTYPPCLLWKRLKVVEQCKRPIIVADAQSVVTTVGKPVTAPFRSHRS